MQCPSCGANVDSAYCGYCGSKMPVERVETRSIHAENVVVNNYYYPEPEPEPQPKAAGSSAGQYAGPPMGFAYSAPASPKSRIVALLLCFFFGFVGAHRFYVGRYLMGVIYVLTFGGLGFAWFVDLILILFGKMRDRNGLPVVTW